MAPFLPLLPVLALLATAAPPTGGRAIALLPLRPLGIDAAIADRLDAGLRAEIAAIPGLRVVPRDKTVAALARRGNDCEADPACVAAVARELSAPRAASGVAAELGSSYVVTLKLLDATSGAESARVSERFQGTGDELLAASRAAAYRLLAPERFVAELEVRCPVEGATLFVDGREVGRTPLARPVEGLAPGPHQLRLTAPGFDELQQRIELRFGRRAVVAVDLRGGQVTAEERAIGTAPTSPAPAAALEPAPEPAGHPLTIAAASVGGAALLTGGVLTAVALGVRSQAAASCDPPGACTSAEASAALEPAGALSTASYVSFGLAGVAGLTALGLFLHEEP